MGARVLGLDAAQRVPRREPGEAQLAAVTEGEAAAPAECLPAHGQRLVGGRHRAVPERLGHGRGVCRLGRAGERYAGPQQRGGVVGPGPRGDGDQDEDREQPADHGASMA